MSNLKQFIVIIIIISIVIIVDIIIANNTKNIINNMNDMLEDLDKSISDNGNSLEKTDRLVEKWKKVEKVLSCYMEHDEIEKIGDKIFLIQKQVQIEAFDDARQSVTETQFLFEHIEQKQILNIENFF